MTTLKSRIIELIECSVDSVDYDNDCQGTIEELAEAIIGEIKVLVEVSGGVADVTTNGVQVCVVDYDNEPDAEIPDEFQASEHGVGRQSVAGRPLRKPTKTL